LDEELKKQGAERRNVSGNIEENKKITRKLVIYLICKWTSPLLTVNSDSYVL